MHGYLILTPSGQKSRYNIFQGFCKNDREVGGFRIFPELRKGLGCHMPNFRSLGQSLHIDIFCKNEGGGGGPIILLSEKAKSIIFSYQKIVVI